MSLYVQVHTWSNLHKFVLSAVGVLRVGLSQSDLAETAFTH